MRLLSSSLPSSIARTVSVAIFAVFAFVMFGFGCGRTSLEPEQLDSGITPPPGTCNASTCPNGCCDRFGACRVGNDINACGSGGASCNDCALTGFDSCGSDRTCARAGCANCRGCCDRSTGVEVCHAGTEASACGIGGEACTDCSTQGRSCNVATGACNQAKCDASNCDGCCVGDKCLSGVDQTACGSFGGLCESCASSGQKCVPAPKGGGTCQGTPTCGPANCGGCCNGTTCVGGGDSTACGKGGAACNNCAEKGQSCVALGQPNERTCQTQPTCSPANCPGCCNGNTCVLTTTPNACGTGGQACKTCPINDTCNAGVCTPTVGCGPGNCGGCCIGDICATGAQDTACGVAGATCQNCSGKAQVCQGGTCATPTCGPANCAGCCSGNVCVLGTQDGACGQNGLACDNCTAASEICQNRVCRQKCSPANCLGCCTGANVCVPGFATNNCGSGGAACVNCGGQGGCDGLVTPRVCNNAQTTCPATVGACPAGTTTPITPSNQNLCTDIGDLDALEAACSGGPDTGTCQAAFTVLQATNASCAKCMTPFDVPFNPPDGIFLCLAPAESTSCNHTTGCSSLCLDTACSQCDAGSFDQCVSTEEQNGGACRNVTTQALQCIAAGNATQLQLCNPQTYGGNFGTWLRAVGRHFCANGP